MSGLQTAAPPASPLVYRKVYRTPESVGLQTGGVVTRLRIGLKVMRERAQAYPMGHWKCRLGVKPHRGFESRPLRFLSKWLDLRPSGYKTPHDATTVSSKWWYQSTSFLSAASTAAISE